MFGRYSEVKGKFYFHPTKKKYKSNVNVQHLYNSLCDKVRNEMLDLPSCIIVKKPGELQGFRFWSKKLGFIKGKDLNYLSASWKESQGFRGEEVRVNPGLLTDNNNRMMKGIETEDFWTKTVKEGITMRAIKPYKVIPVKLKISKEHWIVAYLNTESSFKVRNWPRIYVDLQKYDDKVIHKI